MPESDKSILWRETLPGCSTWSHILKRGTALRMTALDDAPNVAALLFHAQEKTERLNLPDTLKAQHLARLCGGAVLYSDMGRILCSITDDTIGWHDVLGGCSDSVSVAGKYGAVSYADARNQWHQNALDGILVELAKHGLGARDLMMNINFFSKVQVDRAGVMQFVVGHARCGDALELRAEMDTLIVLNSCQHPMDPDPEYRIKAIELVIKRVPGPAADDRCRSFCPENARGFLMTERLYL